MPKKINYGTSVANPEAYSGSGFRVPKCEPCTETPYCQDTLTGAVTAGLSITGIKYSESEENLMFDTPIATDDANFGELLRTAIFYCIKKWESNILLVPSSDGTNWTLVHEGQNTIEQIILNDGTTETTVDVDRKCNLAYECLYRIFLPVGDIAEVIINGETYPLATGSYPAGEAAALTTDIETALTAAGVTGTVVVTEEGDSYQVDITTGDSFSFCVGEKEADNCGCKYTWKDSDDKKKSAKSATEKSVAKAKSTKTKVASTTKK